MTTMNISLPDQLKSHIDQRVNQDGYGSYSEFIRDLVRKDQIQEAERNLVKLIKVGLESGEPVIADDSYWENKKASLIK